jgi:hypothetical protein
MRTLEEESARLKRLVAGLTLDRHILQEVLRKERLVAGAPGGLARWIRERFDQCVSGVPAGPVAPPDLVSPHSRPGSDAAASAHSGAGHDASTDAGAPGHAARCRSRLRPISGGAWISSTTSCSMAGASGCSL